MENINVFEGNAQKYDQWFDKNRYAYESEVLALKRFIPPEGKGVEIGVGTGRFAAPLGIRVGVEPAKAMAEAARKRGIAVYEAKAENLPFGAESFDFVLMVTTICFLENPVQALKEVRRVLVPGGHLIIGMIDKDSFLGRLYESRKMESLFYKNANFYSVKEVLHWLEQLEFVSVRVCQTIFRNPEEISAVESDKDDYGEGAFVVIDSEKAIGI